MYSWRDGSGSVRKVLAHRYIYELLRGPLSDSVCCLHKCDNRRCVNPDHIFLGSRTDNHNDMVSKKRNAVGEACGHKLTLAQVVEIRSLLAVGGLLQREIAARYGVRRTQISRIKNGKRWVEAMKRGGICGS
jgi:hypothetical protein